MDKYYWSFNQDAELWYESGESVGDCIRQAVEMNDGDYKSVYIGEAVPFVLAEHINVEVLLDDLQEQAFEFAGEAAEGWDAYEFKKTEEMEELTAAIGQVIESWLKKYGRYPTFCSIVNVAEYELYEEAVTDAKM